MGKKGALLLMVECGRPVGKCGGTAGVGQSSFCNHCGQDWERE